MLTLKDMNRENNIFLIGKYIYNKDYKKVLKAIEKSTLKKGILLVKKNYIPNNSIFYINPKNILGEDVYIDKTCTIEGHQDYFVIINKPKTTMLVIKKA